MIAKRYLAGGINSGTYAYSNTTPVVGNTTAFDPADNKFYERALHAESRSFLYQPVSAIGTIASLQPGYDSINRLLQYQRGTLNSTGGYQLAGGGSITSPNGLPGTNTQENWNLDGLGNWRATGFIPVGGSQTTDQRSHNNLNEITQRTLTGSGAITFQYDGVAGASNGNLKNDGTLIYAYDSLNRPIQINRASGGAVIGNYVYDALNRRIRKTVSNGGITGNVPNETTDYLWQGWSRRAGISAGGALAGGDEVGHGGSFHKEARSQNLEPRIWNQGAALPRRYCCGNWAIDIHVGR